MKGGSGDYLGTVGREEALSFRRPNYNPNLVPLTSRAIKGPDRHAVET